MHKCGKILKGGDHYLKACIKILDLNSVQGRGTPDSFKPVFQIFLISLLCIQISVSSQSPKSKSAGARPRMGLIGKNPRLKDWRHLGQTSFHILRAYMDSGSRGVRKSWNWYWPLASIQDKNLVFLVPNQASSFKPGEKNS